MLCMALYADDPDCAISVAPMLKMDLDAALAKVEELHRYIAEQNKLVIKQTVELAELQTKGKRK